MLIQSITASLTGFPSETLSASAAQKTSRVIDDYFRFAVGGVQIGWTDPR